MCECYEKASKAYRKASPADSARCLQLLIAHRKSEGEFRRATKPQQELAELYENELGDVKAAIEAWETAGRWFENDRADSLANKCYLKVADLSALEHDYGKAVEKYEGVAKASVANNLMRFSVKEYLLKAGICTLATGDMVGMNRALERYRALDNAFVQQREHQLLVDLTEAVEQSDGEAFAEKLFQYDQMSKLDSWKTTILLRYVFFSFRGGANVHTHTQRSESLTSAFFQGQKRDRRGRGRFLMRYGVGMSIALTRDVHPWALGTTRAIHRQH